MTGEELIADGWRHFDPSPMCRYDALYQIRVRDGSGMRYFVNVTHWRHSKYAAGNPDGWEAEVTYNDGCAFHKPAATRVATWSVADWSPADVRRWAEELWGRLNPTYYEANP